MKNFDEARRNRQASRDDRTFQLGGETFVLRTGIRPDVLAPYDDLGPNTTTVDTLKILDQLLLDLVEPDENAAERYHAIRANEQDPVEMSDLLDVIEWATEVYTARPTGKPSVSEPGQPPTGMSSTADSSSPVSLVIPSV